MYYHGERDIRCRTSPFFLDFRYRFSITAFIWSLVLILSSLVEQTRYKILGAQY